MSQEKVDVIVIGGGLSGLCAAKHLTENGLRVIVLEARDRVGGRLFTIKDSVGGYVDVGGAYVGPTQRRVARLAREFGLQFYFVNVKERSILNLNNKRMTFFGTIPPIWNPFVAMDMNYIMHKLDKLALSVPTNAPWKAPRAEKWDNITFEEFLQKECWTKSTQDLLRTVCRAIMCAEPSEISLLFMLWSIRCGQGVQRLVNIENGAQERKFIGGSMQLPVKIAEKLGDSVILGKPVTKVEEIDDVMVVTCTNGDVYKADYVISAMPQSLLGHLTFNPPLPPLKLQLTQRIPMGSIIKTVMFYEKAFWKEKGYCGQMTSVKGPVIYCVDDTKPDGSSPAIMGFVLANYARDMVRLSPEERKKAIAKHYAATFKCDEFLTPIHYVEKNWMEEEYSGGCYCSTMPPGVLTNYGVYLRRPHSKIHFAGTESATYWYGYMEGAVQSGERAAREILARTGVISHSDIHVDEPADPDFPEKNFQISLAEKILPSVSTFLYLLVTVLSGILIWAYKSYP